MSLIHETDFGTPRSKSETMITLTIDGQSVTVPEGTSIMRAAMEAGTQIPKLCATDMVDAFGSCRLCLVEIDGQARTVTATLAPKLLLKDGRVEKIWVNLTSLEGPTAVKATLWTAARLADNVGLFQRPLIKSVNRFISTTCPKKYPLAAVSPVKGK